MGEIKSDVQAKRRIPRERRWFWIAMLSLLGLYYQISYVTAMFGTRFGKKFGRRKYPKRRQDGRTLRMWGICDPSQQR